MKSEGPFGSGVGQGRCVWWKRGLKARVRGPLEFQIPSAGQSGAIDDESSGKVRKISGEVRHRDPPGHDAAWQCTCAAKGTIARSLWRRSRASPARGEVGAIGAGRGEHRSLTTVRAGHHERVNRKLPDFHVNRQLETFSQ